MLRDLAKRGVRIAASRRGRRAEARKAVEELGGRTASSVSGATDYLLLGEAPGSKLDEARARGIRVLDEDSFARLVGPVE